MALLRSDYSPQANALVFRAKRPSDESLNEACAVLADADPLEVIPLIAPMVLHGKPHLQQLVAPLLMGLAARVLPADWPSLDESIRRYSHDGLPVVLENGMARDPSLAARVLAALSHGNGRTRDRAISLSDALPPMLAACLVLVRVNDWVGAVREHAILTLPLMLAQLEPPEKVALAPLLARVRDAGRHRQPHLFGPWLIHLATHLDESAWITGWQQAGGKHRNIYLEILRSAGAGASPIIRDVLLHSNDRKGILFYLKEVMPNLDASQAVEAMAVIAKSRAVPLRRQYLQNRIEKDPVTALPYLLDTLTDRAKSLRQFARYYLSRLAPMDFTAHYCQALVDPVLETSALRGLAETTPALAHVEALKRFSSITPSLRKAAIECLADEWVSDHLPWLLLEAGCAVPAGAKAARKRISKIPRIVGAHLVSQGETALILPGDVRAFLIQLAPHFGKWDALEFLLVQAFHPSTSQAISGAVIEWQRRMSRSFVRLGTTRKTKLLAALDQASLSNSVQESIRTRINHAE